MNKGENDGALQTTEGQESLAELFAGRSELYPIDTRPLAKARAITHGDVASALVDSLTGQDLFRHGAYVANNGRVAARVTCGNHEAGLAPMSFRATERLTG
jgi:hypothetical protein